MRRLFIALLSSTLCACSSFIPFGDSSLETDPFETATAVYSWQVEGRMVFRCDYDDRGFYWKFHSQTGTVKNDDGKVVGTISGNLTLVHKDGSNAMSRIEKSLRPADGRNAADVRYKVESASARGALHDLRYITRTRTEGGMPLAACSAAQRDTALRVPFTARLIAYR